MNSPLEWDDRKPEPTVARVVRVVGAAILQEDGDGGMACLVARRGSAMAEPGKWEFPGGKIEPGESPRQALAREIQEELALEIAVGDWLGRGTSESGGRRIVLDVYLARIVSGEVRLAEHAEQKWIRTGDIAGLDWAAADVPVLNALTKALRNPR